MLDKEFTSRLKNKWFELRGGIFSTASIHAYIDSVNVVLYDAQNRNFQRWPVLGNYIWPNYFVGNTYYEEISYVKTWIEHRLTWLDYTLDNIVTSLEYEPSDNTHIKLYPNPFNRDLMVTWKDPMKDPIIWEIYNMLGEKIYGTRVNKDNKISEIIWDGRDSSGRLIPEGMYLSLVKVNGKVIYQTKLIRN